MERGTGLIERKGCSERRKGCSQSPEYSHIVVNSQYKDIFPPHNGYFTVYKNGFYGVIDDLGNEIVNPIYSIMPTRIKDMFIIDQDGKLGCINNNSEILIAPQYDSILFLAEGLLRVKKDTKWGSIDFLGNEVIPIEYDRMSNQYKGLVSCTKDGKCGLLNLKGDIVVPFVYDKITMPAENDELIQGKYGFINIAGTEMIECKWDSALFFKNGLCFVSQGNRGFFIDTEGNTILEATYSGGYVFNDNLIAVFINEQSDDMATRKYGLIGFDGKIIIQPEYDSITSLNDELILLKMDHQYGELYGIANKYGEILYEPIYTKISSFNNGYCLLIGEQTWNIINELGEIVF